MNSILPDINLRSFTPVNKFKKATRKSNFIKKSDLIPDRNHSLSPGNFSNNYREMLEFDIAKKAYSDQIKSNVLEKNSIFLKVSNLFPSNLKKSRTDSRKLSKMTPILNYSETIDAIFTVHNCENGKISGINLVSLFVSLGLCDRGEICVDILSGLHEGISLGMIYLSKEEILKICQDPKTNQTLKFLNKNLVKPKETYSRVQIYSMTIKKLWNKIDKNQNGLVSFEEIIKFSTELGFIESTQDIKRIFIKIGQFGNYKQFYSLFSRSLFKVLIQELHKVIRHGNLSFLPAEMAITTHRRKTILNSLEGQNKVIDAMAGCFKYNNL